jgi:integrase/recombinase XerD
LGFSDIEGEHYGAWLLGHKKLDTTALYTRVAVSALGEVTSPLDFLLKMPG